MAREHRKVQSGSSSEPCDRSRPGTPGRQGGAARKPVSKKKIEANRRNARKSTGPKTPEGKGRVKWNALKHGLLSKEVVIAVGDGRESRSAYEALLRQLRADLEPQGTLEEMLIEKMAILYWRQRRVLRCENGEIRQALATIRWRDHSAREENAFAVMRMGFSGAERRRRLEKNSLGLEWLIGCLEDVRQEVETVGPLSDEARVDLVAYFGDPEDSDLVRQCDAYTAMARKGQTTPARTPGQDGDMPSPAQCKKTLLDLIDAELEQLNDRKAAVERSEALQLEAQVATLALPDREGTENILRYETTFERQLYRAITQYLGLQERRRKKDGEASGGK